MVPILKKEILKKDIQFDKKANTLKLKFDTKPNDFRYDIIKNGFEYTSQNCENCYWIVFNCEHFTELPGGEVEFNIHDKHNIRYRPMLFSTQVELLFHIEEVTYAF